MAPVRTEKSFKPGESSSAGTKKTKTKRKYTSKHSVAESSALPGVQKLKASLRQTRRLLAKDTLAADVRVETERRLKALEADIAQAQSSRVERTMSVRYHKAKFFERQKVVRKISQTKKKLAADDISSKSKKKTELALCELRVDLNYILHYPKSKKYISLFPPETRQTSSEEPTISPADTVKTDAQRDDVRKWIHERMDKGELWSEPELHLDAKESSGKKAAAEWGGADDIGKIRESAKRKGRKSAEIVGGGGVETDAFFGDDDEGDPEHEPTSGDEDEDESD